MMSRFRSIAATGVLAATALGWLSVEAATTAEAGPRHTSYMAAAGTIRDCIQETSACKWHLRVPKGTNLRMNCWADGRTAKGRYRSDRWFYATTESGARGYIHSSWVEKQTRVGHCRHHIGVRAATWAAEQNGRRAPRASEAALIGNREGRWQGWCKGFTTVAHARFGRGVVRGDAIATWRTLHRAGKGRTNLDPKKIAIGAMVFWNTGDRYGHAAIYVGNGFVMSTQGAYTGATGPGLAVARRPLSYWGRPVGWVHPRDVGG